MARPIESLPLCDRAAAKSAAPFLDGSLTDVRYLSVDGIAGENVLCHVVNYLMCCRRSNHHHRLETRCKSAGLPFRQGSGVRKATSAINRYKIREANASLT